jgi:PPOX class probable F420-dependent enzyme
MTHDERRAFLLAAPARTGKLAAVRKDGGPFVVPVWFDLDGDDLIFTTGADTLKGRAIARTGRVALCVDDERPPFAYAALEGRAALSDDLAEVRAWAERIGERYVPGQGAAFGARNGVPGELLVRVRPERWSAFAEVSA